MSTVLNDVAREAHAVGIDDTHNAVGSNVEICDRVDEAGHRVVIVINHNTWCANGSPSADTLEEPLAGHRHVVQQPSPLPTHHSVHSPAGGRRGSRSGEGAVITRRRFIETGVATAAIAATPFAHGAADPVAPYRSPYQYPELILKATGNKQDFDGLSVDDPIVFRANARFHMLYIGFDGTGYQTGLAESTDLIRWTRTALVGPRDPASEMATVQHLAVSSILRDKNLHGGGDLIKVDGQFLAVECVPRSRI